MRSNNTTFLSRKQPIWIKLCLSIKHVHLFLWYLMLFWNIYAHKIIRRNNNSQRDSSVKGFAIVQHRISNNCGIKVALKPFQTLGHSFVKPKDRVSTIQKTHAVYSIPCSECEKEYLGQTKRQIWTDLKDLQEANSKLDSSKSALAEQDANILGRWRHGWQYIRPQGPTSNHPWWRL